MMMTIHSSQRISWGERNEVCVYIQLTHEIWSLCIYLQTHTAAIPHFGAPHSTFWAAAALNICLWLSCPAAGRSASASWSKGWCSSTRACTNCSLISEEKQMQLLLVVQQEQKWEQVLPSNPFQTILWICELTAQGDGQIQAFRRKTTLLAFLASDAASQSKTHHYWTAVQHFPEEPQVPGYL